MRLLIVSDSPAIRSGLGRVTRELAQRFADDNFEVAVAGWFDLHGSLDEEYDYAVYPAVKPAPESLARTIAHVDPQVILAIGDPWDFAWLADQRAAGAPWRLVGYLNIEGRPLPLACERILDAFDVLVTTSEFGAQAVGRPSVRAVHHGVDMATFRKLGERKGEFCGRDLARTFLVMLNGQNTPRKNYPTALRGFRLFAEGKPDVLLYANTAVSTGPDDQPGPDLRQTLVGLGVDEDDRVWFNPDNRGPLATVSDDHVNKIYNMASVLLVTSWAEGFCLPVLEAMAAAVIPVAPADYSMPELLAEDRGILYPVAARVENTFGMQVAVVSDWDVAEALERAYREWKDDRAAWDRRRVRCTAYARTKNWNATYQGLKAAMSAWTPGRVAIGRPVSPQARAAARAAAARHPGALGVLKLGGLGDLLQTTPVIAAAAAKTGRKVVVFTNQPAPVFEENPAVAEVVAIEAMPQQVALESLADAFEAFYDLRYVSWAYGAEKPSAFAERHRWFYDHWTDSNPRLHSLGMHSTRVMLTSLDLESDSIRPIYKPRQKCEIPAEPYLAAASGVGVMGGLKRWPAEAWAKLLAGIGVPVVQVGGSEDEPLPGAVDRRGASLPQTAWVLENAAGLVAVEGGMVHLAAATGIRVAVIFGPTPVETFLYPGHWAAVTRRCTPCWGAEPNWSQAVCAVAEPVCRNFPNPDTVLDQVKAWLHD